MKKILFLCVIFLIFCLGCQCATTTKKGNLTWSNSLKPQGESVNINADIIIIPNNADEKEKLASNELSKYLSQALGKEINVINESEYTEGSFISVGNTDKFKSGGFDDILSKIEGEGYGLYAKDGNMYIFGGDRRGPIFGVYALLEEDLGFRFWNWRDGEEFIPQIKIISFVPRYYNPCFDVRFLGMSDAFENDVRLRKNKNYMWTLRNKMNPMGYLDNNWTAFPNEIGGSLVVDNQLAHSSQNFCSADEYFDSHPEYFSLINGKRVKDQLCFSNGEVINICIENIKKKFAEGNVTVIEFSPRDGKPLCQCDKCRELDEREGTKAATLYVALNKIIKAVNEDYPYGKILTLAYQDYVYPPKTIVPDKNLYVYVCSDNPDWKYPLYDLNRTETFRNNLKKWEAFGANTIVWSYPCNYDHYLIPQPNMIVIGNNLRIMRDNGADGVQMQSNQVPASMRDSGEIRTWVWAKQLWNPDLDTEALMKDFIFGYYGKAAPIIWEFENVKLDLWKKNYSKVTGIVGDGKHDDKDLDPNIEGKCRYTPYSPFYGKNFTTVCDKYLNKLNAIEKTNPELKDKIDRYKSQMIYYILAHDLGYWPCANPFINTQETKHPKLKSKEYYEGLIAELKSILDKEQIHLMCEHEPTWEFKDQFFIEWEKVLNGMALKNSTKKSNKKNISVGMKLSTEFPL